MEKPDYSKSQLLPIESLFDANLSFEIPDYQRGYRWTNIQVEDLLDDVLEFHNRTHVDGNTTEKYILQPVVVDYSKTPIQVIDGQQRLTTIFLIFNYLNKTGLYNIEYQSRKGSDNYLKKDKANSLGEKNLCIDYFYMYGVKEAIEEWFIKTFDSSTSFKERYIDTFLKRVNIVWEPIEEGEDPIDVFTRINGGAIPLMDSELIKAMFLDKSKYSNDGIMAEAHQLEIASCWESIENALQNDEFWSFICNESLFAKYESGSPRIDYFLEIITNNNSLKIDDKSFQEFEEKNKDGKEGKYYKDEHRIFRYFDKKFEGIADSDSLMECWKIIKDIYLVLVEWYQDCKLFHYIGYLILTSENKAVDEIGELLKEYRKKNKEEFVNYVHKRISGVIANKKWLFDKTTKEFNWEYEYDETADGDTHGVKSKSECVEILLLHNVETIVRQNDYLIKDERYNLPNFTRFELHLYKRNSWQVEHIRPNSNNKLDSINDKQLYIKTALPYLREYENYKNIVEDNSLSDRQKENALATIEKKGLYKGIFKYLQKDPEKRSNKNYDSEFNTISDLIDESIEAGSNQLQNNAKNKIWNYTLLDSKDNQEYGNKIFPVKRFFLSYKEQGIKIKVNDLAEYMLGLVSMDDLITKNKVESVISFIPPITKNVFAKTFTKYPHNMTSWTYEDAEAYLNNMKEVLHVFIEEAKAMQ